MFNEKLVIVRGGGDLATGTIHRLYRAGLRILILEIAMPAAIRRQVSACEAVYDNKVTIEGMVIHHVHSIEEMQECWSQQEVPIIIDEQGVWIERLKPEIVVDAIMAKKNLGTNKKMAPYTIALGPGFEAPIDVDAVIETSRGHRLAKVIEKGMAKPDTGIPGVIAGVSEKRVIHAKSEGIIKNMQHIGDAVKTGDVIAIIEDEKGHKTKVEATTDGIIRGLIRDEYPVTVGFKIADIDPRYEELSNCFTISDKARSIGGSVLECICHYFYQKEKV